MEKPLCTVPIMPCGNAGAGAAALAFNLLLVYAFLAPTRSTVAAIVREKELRLREGMRILGLRVSFCMSVCLLIRARLAAMTCGRSALGCRTLHPAHQPTLRWIMLAYV